MNNDYLKLFEKINNSKEKYELIKETPNYNDLPKLNETPDVSKFNINENLNDGWNIDFKFETRVNGVVQKSNNPYQQSRREKVLKNDLNGLNKFIDDEPINEVYNPIKSNIESNDVITLEMFNRMRENSMIPLYRKIVR